MRRQLLVGKGGMIERHRRGRHLLIARAMALRRAAMIADHPQHHFAVLVVAREGAELGRHLRRGGIADAGHDGGQRCADRAAGFRIVGNARRHQKPADIGVAQAERAEVVGALGDLARGELRHQHRDFEHDGPQPRRVLVAFDVIGRCSSSPSGWGVEREKVQRGEIAGRVVEEHVFRARIGGENRPRRRAGVPVVDRGVELQAGIGARPGGVADLLPQIARLHGPGDLARLGAPEQIPLAVGFDGFEKLVSDPHRVVGILTRNREIGLRVPVGVVGREIDILVALLGELDHAPDVTVRHAVLARRLDLAAEHRVLVRIEAIVARARAIHAGLQDGAQMPLVDLRAGDEVRDLLLFGDLPVDELLDVRMVGIEDDHLGGAARGAAGFDRARGAVADLEEAHQARRLAAARELFAFAAELGEIRAGARAVFEQPRLAHPQIHDPALVDEVVGDRLDEAGMRLRMLVGGRRLRQLAGFEIDVEMALARPVDAIGPMQAGVEPLRRIGRHHLHRQHVAVLVEEGVRVGFRGEVAALPAPIGPGAGKPVEHLLAGGFADEALFLRQRGERLFVGDAAPQPGGNGLLLDLFQARGHARLTEIFLRQNVGGDLRPLLGHFHIVGVEDNRAVRIADFAHGEAKSDVRVW